MVHAITHIVNGRCKCEVNRMLAYRARTSIHGRSVVVSDWVNDALKAYWHKKAIKCHNILPKSGT